MKRESFKEKQARILTAMAAKEILDAVTDAANVLKQVNSINPDPGLETKRQLFYFKGNYLHVEGGELKKLSESEAEKLLNKTPDVKIYFICAETICHMPKLLSGKDQMEGVKKKDATEVAAFISEKTGIEVKVTDL